MPIYTVEIDGKQYDIEGDRPPTEQEARQVVGAVRGPSLPADATAGMMAPSRVTDPPDPADPRNAPLGGAGDYVRGMGSAIPFAGIEQPRSLSGNQGAMLGNAIVGALPFERAVAAVPGVIAGAKKVPGIIAKAAGVSKARAGGNIDSAVAAAKDAAVPLGAVNESVGKMMEFSGIENVPRAVRALARRIADAGRGPLTVEEARKYYPAISRGSANEYAGLTPNMQRLLGDLRGVMNTAITEGTEVVGKGAQYTAGMKEFANAAKWQRRAEEVKPAAKRALRFLLKATAGGSAAKAGWDVFGD